VDNIEQAFKVVHMRLKLYAYELQIVQEIKPNDKPLREQFAVDLLECFDQDEHFLHNVDFSDEATLQLSGKVNRHNCRIWGYENSHAFREYERHIPKINVWCALSYNHVTEQFFFHKKILNSVSYLGMLATIRFRVFCHPACCPGM
jgi:hypothetical protein